MLAAEGAQVVGTARSEAAFAAVADEVRMAGGLDPVLLVADFVEDGAAERLAAAVLARAGRVDVLVNNAGGSRPMTVPDDGAAWTEGLRLGFEAPRRLADRLVPPMLDRGWGRQGGAGKLVKDGGGHLRGPGRDGELRVAGAAEHGADPGTAAPDRGGPAGLHRAEHPGRAVRGRGEGRIIGV